MNAAFTPQRAMSTDRVVNSPGLMLVAADG